MVLVALALLLSGCAAMEDPVKYAKRKMIVNDSDGKPLEKPEVMFDKAMAMVGKKQYSEAIKVFDEIEELYPFSRFAQRAMVISAYVNYREKNYTVTEAIMERFVDTYRNYKDLDYAYYLKAMAQYNQIKDIRHDHEVAMKAHNSMLSIMALFPNSPYAHEVEDRVLVARYYLAAKDVDVGRFYMKSRDYLAAMLRFNKYLSEYPDAYYTPEILYRLVVCSEMLGMDRESGKYYALLSYNFPYSFWHVESDRFLELKARIVNDGKYIKTDLPISLE